MSDIAIRVEGLSKRYRIGQRERDNALRDVITDVFVAPFRRLRENSPSAIRNSECLSGCLLPSAFCVVVLSRFTGSLRNQQSQIGNRKSQIANVLFVCLLPAGLSHFAIRHSKFAMFFWLPSAHCLLASDI